MYLDDSIQKTLRSLGKISDREVVKKEGDIYVAFNVLTNESRILASDHHLIESLSTNKGGNVNQKILKG
jgi:hypothetical protein